MSAEYIKELQKENRYLRKQNEILLQQLNTMLSMVNTRLSVTPSYPHPHSHSHPSYTHSFSTQAQPPSKPQPDTYVSKATISTPVKNDSSTNPSENHAPQGDTTQTLPNLDANDANQATNLNSNSQYKENSISTVEGVYAQNIPGPPSTYLMDNPSSSSDSSDDDTPKRNHARDPTKGVSSFSRKSPHRRVIKFLF